jgi:hypothetical protein
MIGKKKRQRDRDRLISNHWSNIKSVILIKEHEKLWRERESYVNQLVTSEQAYLKSLDLVVSVFLTPLKKDSKQTSFNFLGSRKLVCTERELKWLFGNFETIVEIHRTILASLEQR